MLESFIVISISGFITGILFSVPAAGPITILIISKGLKGMRRFCHRVAYGASIADLIYSFVAVYAFSNLFEYYQPYIPYILAIGSVFLIFLGIKIYKTKIDVAHINEEAVINDQLLNKGGFRSGLVVNFLNPTLFVGWLVSSFFILSLLASLGFNTGGLSTQINSNINNVNSDEISEEIQGKQETINSILGDTISIKENRQADTEISSSYTFFLSLVFALMIAAGSTLWFYFLGSFVVRHRHKFKIDTINRIINSLGIILILIGVYFAISSI